MERENQSETHVLIWAPTGRDAQLTDEALRRAGYDTIICRSLDEACKGLTGENTGTAIVAEEALSPQRIKQLKEALSSQPPWSDIPIILLTGGGRSTEASLGHLQRMRGLGNITLLERPLRSVTLIAAVQSALASRKRQREIRNYVHKLQQTQDSLAQANADLKQFAFAASHDLQEPLRMVNIFSQLLLSRHIDPANREAAQYAEYIRTGVRRMEALLRDVLHYSRAVHESGEWATHPFNLAGAVQEAMDVLKLEIEATGAEITYGAMPSVRGDRNQLSLVFQNLLSNSMKYARPGIPPEITIDVTESAGEYLIRVRDNGIGFEQVYAERIFDLFQRLDNSNEISGTGLGLAICRRTIQKHGGRIWAESQPGQGATFFFTLPIRDGANG